MPKSVSNSCNCHLLRICLANLTEKSVKKIVLNFSSAGKPDSVSKFSYQHHFFGDFSYKFIRVSNGAMTAEQQMSGSEASGRLLIGETWRTCNRETHADHNCWQRYTIWYFYRPFDKVLCRCRVSCVTHISFDASGFVCKLRDAYGFFFVFCRVGQKLRLKRKIEWMPTAGHCWQDKTRWHDSIWHLCDKPTKEKKMNK